MQVVLDTTTQEPTETAPIESRRFIDATLNALSAHIAVLDQHGTILAINEAWRRFAEANAAAPDRVGEGVNYLAVADGAAEETAAAAAAGIRAVIRGERYTFRMEYPCVSPQEERWFVLRVSRFPAGSPIRVVVAHEEATERKRAESASLESERRFQDLFKSSPEAIFIMSLEGHVLDANPAACRLQSSDVESLMGINLRDLVPPEQYEPAVRKLSELGEGELSFLDLHGWAVNAHLVPVEARMGRFTYCGRPALLLHVRDVSERRTLEQEVLRISEEERQRIGRDLHDGLVSLLSGVAMGIQAQAQAAREGEPVSASTLEWLAQVVEAGASQAQSVAQGLNPVMLGGEGLPAALQDLVEVVCNLAPITCSVQLDRSVPALSDVVAVQLYRIAQEALNNTLKHAKANRLTLRLAVERDHLALTIEDDGVELPADTRSRGGSGLHIMLHRARLIGASLAIGEAPEGGTLVSCRLPLKHAFHSLLS